MKKIPLQIAIVVASTLLTIVATYKIYSDYQLNKLKIETERTLNESAIKSGMSQVPVDICTELHQELKWVRSEDYTTDIMLEGVE